MNPTHRVSTTGNTTSTNHAAHSSVNVRLDATQAQASIWSSIAKTIFPSILMRGFRSLMLSLSSSPYHRIRLDNLDMNAEAFDYSLQELGVHLSIGTNEDGSTITRDSDDLDKHLLEEFTTDGRTAEDLIDFSYNLQEKKDTLTAAMDTPPTRAQRAQLAGINALIRSYQNLVAQQIFGNKSEGDILDMIPAKELQALVDEKRALQKQSHTSNPRASVSTPMGSQFHISTESDLDSAPVRLRGADYLRALPEDKLVELLLAHPLGKALALAELLPYETDAELDKQQDVYERIEASIPVDTVHETAPKTITEDTNPPLNLEKLAELDDDAFIAECDFLLQSGLVIPLKSSTTTETMVNKTFKYEAIPTERKDDTHKVLLEKRNATEQRIADLNNQIRRQNILLKGLELQRKDSIKRDQMHMQQDLRTMSSNKIQGEEAMDLASHIRGRGNDRTKISRDKIYKRIAVLKDQLRKAERAYQAAQTIVDRVQADSTSTK